MKKRIPLSIQIFYGLGVSYAIVDQIFAQWILYFYLPPESSGLKPVMAPLLISLALVISRLVDMVTDPLVGFLSDRVNTRWGRRIPFIAVGTIPLALCTIAFFYPLLRYEIIRNRDNLINIQDMEKGCLLYTSPSPRDRG